VDHITSTLKTLINNSEPFIKKITSEDKVIVLSGNPNVGKSTVFNNLTGLNQHTGNWPGKTVTTAQGYCHFEGSTYILVDIPGTYSLMTHSAEEEVARNLICFSDPDAIIVVCDATCLERNLNLVLQTLEITSKVVVCVNLMDESKRKNIRINLNKISKKLNVPVIGTTARNKKDLIKLLQAVKHSLSKPMEKSSFKIEYLKPIEDAVTYLEPFIRKKVRGKINPRWLSLKLLDFDETLIAALNNYLGFELLSDAEIYRELGLAKHILLSNGISDIILRDSIVSSLVMTAERICADTIQFDNNDYNGRDRQIDKVLTNRWIGFPIMIILLMGIFWLTITGANYPSQLMANSLFWIQNRLSDIFQYFKAPEWLHGMLVLGVYRVLAWVVSVMLPPMAIFFPLFTLLEDLGYLPRVAFNLDKYFKKCSACGKQALTMCMGFGCNAAGIVGCRIIDSPRERLIAIITNNFVPCNGRFPTLIVIITMFFVNNASGLPGSVFSSILLTLVIVIGIFMTFIVSNILSKTILKGIPSSFTLELPPYRKPQIGKVIVRSIFDRTLRVLGRAVVVAIPAGFIIWIIANTSLNNITLLTHSTNLLDPFAKLLGMDGAILLAFILGFPANEIVIPIIIMTYMASGSIMELDNLWSLKQLFVDNGWTWITAISTMIFSLMHWPCSTTCLTIKKETQSLKWTVVSFIVPTLVGIIFCFFFTSIVNLFM
jgi:ferrous iron transport protein B